MDETTSKSEGKEIEDEFTEITLRRIELSDVDDFMEWETDEKLCDCIDSCRPKLGYVLAYKYWGKGIVTKAVKIVMSNIFSEWSNLERLEALMDIENKGSQRVLEKAGFLREGVLRKFKTLKGKLRDMVIFSFLSTDAL
ncbi:hypothetical protein RND71_009997 [Anisodus tanguticus]|uniref:N-acetyltransferase domain-containing protein n=1 Tax=Anisodus tanguticus TaxID=243964 RepID=A0AAE1VIR2_9SOLA|nr:hypothetical protein RND71_009997 [Anisodus tanguticus]